ncbi:NAD kinase [Propionibacterium australiense]|uniref:NAD kinase n=1 Tax=Propionibacterium australiense TaxID=119981 RepID=A0A383S9Z5_9ACTN|nr:NAD kinase [Propionibacterium australiense]RLP06773.1 NAD kinase [Propionibacterium australiense]RLP06939.1 NAD kinase [Propionibacterium australiense]SYZ34066.1 NAD+ kinase [Propionibacterium australiense]VEH92120.1 Inorganic polyphosphate/ATP-NAD kinase [Propionibacterium australiense]
MEETRCVAVVIHPTRQEAVASAVEFIEGMHRHGIACMVEATHLDEVRARLPEVGVTPLSIDSQVELIAVFGGDGSILRASEWALPRGIPLLGVNLGHVGFLAELEASEIGELIEKVAARDYMIEKRLTLRVRVFDADGATLWTSFAVNEVSTEKASRRRMADLMVLIDGRPLSRWACDGVLVASASGSTAYGFSAGGPVIWPNTEAFEVVPIAAHALFSQACVVAPSSQVELQLLGDLTSSAIVWCDGRRSFELRPGYSIVVERHPQDLQIARLAEQPFTTRLVKKFGLDVEGWRAPRRQGD